MVSLCCFIMNIPFPFIPIQITLIDACIEAYPSFLTIFEKDAAKIEENFLRTVLKRAFPFAAAITVMIVGITLISPFSTYENTTVMYLLLILTSMTAVIKSCMPFTKLRIFLCVTMVLGTFCALMLFPTLFEISQITQRMFWFTVMIFSGIIIFLSLILNRIWK